MSAYIVEFFHESHFSNKTTKNIFFLLKVQSQPFHVPCFFPFSFLLLAIVTQKNINNINFGLIK